MPHPSTSEPRPPRLAALVGDALNAEDKALTPALLTIAADALDALAGLLGPSESG